MGRYVVITGGELYNKGAQAMSFITVDQIRRKFPDRKIILFSSKDYAEKTEKEKARYRFEILPFPGVGEISSLCTGLLHKRYAKRDEKLFARYNEIFSHTDALLDISGYALGSNWKENINRAYLLRLVLTKHYKIPVYLMPQSFGPFDYSGVKGWLFSAALKHYLKYPKKIMAREETAKKYLEGKYKLKNVIKTPDMVLQNKGIDYENVFYDQPAVCVPDVKSGSVAIIPNSKNNKFGDESALLGLYRIIIDYLLAMQANVYLIYHAVEDLAICEKIKASFYADSEQVIVITEELSCADYEEIVPSFDFIIASRYHSIIHAYKEGIPAVVLGWAYKYRELAGLYGQTGFCFDVREALDGQKLICALEDMQKNHVQYSEKIKKITDKIQSENVFDLIKL